MEPTRDVLRLARSPPVVGLALAAGAGATLLHLGVPLPWTLLLLPVFLLLNRSSHRPGFPRGALALSLLSGSLLTLAWREARPADCRFRLREGQVIRVDGSVGRAPGGGAGGRSSPEAFHGGCAEVLRLVVSRARRIRMDGGEPPERSPGGGGRAKAPGSMSDPSGPGTSGSTLWACRPGRSVRA